jgi:thiamine kinase-like enzyme
MVNLEKLQLICNQFKIQSGVQSIKTLESGHINDTYLITLNTNEDYVLQKLNSTVFKDIESIMANKVAVSQHIKQLKSPYKSVSFVMTKTSKYYYKDDTNNYWNMMGYISNSVTYDVANNSKTVFEAGKLYGDFMTQTATLSSGVIKETLPNFHNVPLRFAQFEQALKNAENINIVNAKEAIDFAKKNKDEMCELAALKAKNTFPIRITHNDAKLSNILFNKNEEGIAVIDLDTVMPGIVHFDFGDSVRSICTNTVEDDDNFDAIAIKLDYYEAFCKGHADSTKNILTPQEIKYLPLGVKTIIFIMGLRFLTDYLNNNKYYKVKYDTHNLVRCKNQFKLVESVQQHYDHILKITYNCYGLNNLN